MSRTREDQAVVEHLAESSTRSALYYVIQCRPSPFRPFAFRTWQKWARPEMQRLSALRCEEAARDYSE